MLTIVNVSKVDCLCNCNIANSCNNGEVTGSKMRSDFVAEVVVLATVNLYNRSSVDVIDNTTDADLFNPAFKAEYEEKGRAEFFAKYNTILQNTDDNYDSQYESWWTKMYN